jgi:hypothetical protein
VCTWTKVLARLCEDYGVPVTCTCDLTKKRSKLLFEIRKLKRAGKVTKFYSDEDGVISVRLANNNNKNERVTNIRNKETSFLSTMTVEELLEKAQ